MSHSNSQEFYSDHYECPGVPPGFPSAPLGSPGPSGRAGGSRGHSYPRGLSHRPEGWRVSVNRHQTETKNPPGWLPPPLLDPPEKIPQLGLAYRGPGGSRRCPPPLVSLWSPRGLPLASLLCFGCLALLSFALLDLLVLLALLALTSLLSFFAFLCFACLA